MVSSNQRFTRQQPCPICGGCDQDSRGTGVRCYGYMSPDGDYANCTRSEYAGQLAQRTDDTYGHRLRGECRCGTVHGTQETTTGQKTRIVAEFDYRDKEGHLLHQTVRLEPKRFMQRRPDGNGGWIWDLKGVEPALYRLPELLAADPSQPVFITEGEKQADLLWELGLVATTFPMGAGKSHLVKDVSVLETRHVVILPDNDAPGRSHVQQVADRVY